MPSGPKNTKFTNRHAEEARARDAQKDNAQQEARKKALEDAMWEDDDKQAQKRAERAAERASKADAKAERKAENKVLFETETKKSKRGGDMEEFRKLQVEVARQAHLDLEERRRQDADAQKGRVVDNTGNEALVAAAAASSSSSATSESAPEQQEIVISGKTGAVANQLKQIFESKDATSDEFRRTMARRAKVLYKAFCEENEKRVREENPNMRRTQLLNVLWDEWQSCAQNPFVQRKEALAERRVIVERTWMEAEHSESDDDDDEKKKEKKEDGGKSAVAASGGKSVATTVAASASSSPSTTTTATTSSGVKSSKK